MLDNETIRGWRMAAEVFANVAAKVAEMGIASVMCPGETPETVIFAFRVGKWHCKYTMSLDKLFNTTLPTESHVSDLVARIKEGYENRNVTT